MERVPDFIIRALAPLKSAIAEFRETDAVTSAVPGSPSARGRENARALMREAEEVIRSIEAHPNPPVSATVVDEVDRIMHAVLNATAIVQEDIS